jgi:hypothetical protein
MVEYARLPELEIPEGMHVVLVDPPASEAQAAWARHRASGRWLHLVWGEPEVELARRAAEDEWELRPAAAAIWSGLRDGRLLPWGPELERVLLGDGPVSRAPRTAARALAVLAELGLVEAGEEGVRAVPDPARRDLDASPRYRACRARLEAALAYLDLAHTLDLGATGAEHLVEPALGG